MKENTKHTSQSWHYSYFCSFVFCWHSVRTNSYANGFNSISQIFCRLQCLSSSSLHSLFHGLHPASYHCWWIRHSVVWIFLMFKNHNTLKSLNEQNAISIKMRSYPVDCKPLLFRYFQLNVRDGWNGVDQYPHTSCSSLEIYLA